MHPKSLIQNFWGVLFYVKTQILGKTENYAAIWCCALNGNFFADLLADVSHFSEICLKGVRIT